MKIGIWKISGIILSIIRLCSTSFPTISGFGLTRLGRKYEAYAIDPYTIHTVKKHRRGTTILMHNSTEKHAGTFENSAVTTNIDTSISKFGPKASVPGVVRKSFPLFPWHRLPNWLTYSRCISIPIMVGLFYLPGYHVQTSFLFAMASFTDWLDGYLARRWDIRSDFGAFLDPVVSVS